MHLKRVNLLLEVNSVGSVTYGAALDVILAERKWILSTGDCCCVLFVKNYKHYKHYKTINTILLEFTSPMSQRTLIPH